MTDWEETGKDLDLDTAMAHVGGDEDLLAELADLFLQDYVRLIREMKDSIPQTDYSTFERAAHTLKGRLAFFGAQRLREQALALEMMGRSRNLSLAPKGLADLETALERVLPEFAALAKKQTG
jgi:HPt (histidine-containing phosphotransfer) domain-containing protein